MSEIKGRYWNYRIIMEVKRLLFEENKEIVEVSCSDIKGKIEKFRQRCENEGMRTIEWERYSDPLGQRVALWKARE